MKSRKTLELSERFNKRWVGYAAAAAAAGIGLAFSAPSANADIIFTPASSSVPQNGSLGVDVNHDGTVDFTLTNVMTNHSFVMGTQLGGSLRHLYGGAGMRAYGPLFVANGGSHPARLPLGAFIGSYQKGTFIAGGKMVSAQAKFGTIGTTFTYTPGQGRRPHPINRRYFSLTRASGPWTESGIGYLGFVFTAADGFHYGWASLDITERSSPTYFYYQELLTGYAYNTDPNAPITAGEGFRTPEPGTLGLLALGSLGLGLWRRRAGGTHQ